MLTITATRRTASSCVPFLLSSHRFLSLLYLSSSPSVHAKRPLFSFFTVARTNSFDDSGLKLRATRRRCLRRCPSSFVHRFVHRADSSTEAATLGRVAQVNVTNGRQRATPLSHDALLHQMRQAQILVDIAVAAAMLVLRVAPLSTISPLIVRCRAEQHGFR